VDVDAVPQAELLRLEVDPTPILSAHARHRRRFGAEVASLDADALAVQSRCHKWSVADVLRHLCDVDSWMDDMWAGRPPAALSGGFDPNTTPHECVLVGRSVPDLEVRDRFVAACEVMAADVESSGPERWANPAFSPLGAVPWWLSAMHAFYDSWTHERDCLMPLGLDLPLEADEVTPVLGYALGLAGVFVRDPLDTVVAGMRVRAGTRPVIVTPADAATDHSTDAAALADALSGRGDIEHALPDADPAVAHTLGALARRLQPVE
jgi:uncharacterized protein (TIGR03083 family)